MRHRWAKRPIRRSGKTGWKLSVRSLREAARRSHCVQCGAVVYAVRGERYQRHKAFPVQYFVPWGGIERVIDKMPACAGLPPDYDAPMGG